ncbi:MAG: sodium:solute symporter [Planctomycetota bacterium]|jgi:SSS family solute:Na+ symporter
METLDWLTIAGYFALLFGLAIWVIRRNRDTADDYFLAGRNLSWWIVGASIFASNIGSEHLVGLAGSGCTDGVAMAHYELHAWCLLVLGWLFVPFYARSRVFTMPEFLERRYSAGSRLVLSAVSLIAYVLTKIAVGIYAGGIVFRTLLPEAALQVGSFTLDSFWIGSILVILLTGAYTVIGGLRAVAYTEALQTLVLVLGSILVTIYGLIALGGWGQLREVAGSEMFNLWKPLVPEGMTGTWEPVHDEDRIAWYFNADYPWLGMLFCAPVIGLWYWCTDQYIVQRALGARDEQQARRGSIFAAFLKLLPVFIFIVPGMICYALAESGAVSELREALFTSGELDRAKSQAAFPLMVKHVLPAGVRGLVVAGLLAALMSSLAGVFNASSTLFTMDMYSRWRPHASQHQLVWMGRVVTALMVVVGLLWVPVIQGGQGLYHYLQSVQGYLAPPIFVVFFLGIFASRFTSRACLATLIIGFALGLFRLAVDTPTKLWDHEYAHGSLLWVINKIYFQYYSLLIFLVCVASMLVISSFGSRSTGAGLSGMTFQTTSEEARLDSRRSWNQVDVFASLGVLLAILAAYLYFSG